MQLHVIIEEHTDCEYDRLALLLAPAPAFAFILTELFTSPPKDRA